MSHPANTHYPSTTDDLTSSHATLTDPATGARSQPQEQENLPFRVNHILFAGLTSGVVVAALFNPWDRALYLSVLHNRPFLMRCNWTRPYTGFMQSLLGRTMSGGLYFPLYDLFLSPFRRIAHYLLLPRPAQSGLQNDSALVAFLAGNSAGAVSGIAMNHLTTVKYQSWKTKERFLDSARSMFRQGGIRPFLKGIGPTVYRDLVFGGVFAWLKFQCRAWAEADADHHSVLSAVNRDFLCASTSAGVATVASSPINWYRNLVYGSSPDQPQPTVNAAFRALGSELRSSKAPIRHLVKRFRIGWGTARVAVGMACGSQIYEYTKERLHEEKGE